MERYFALEVRTKGSLCQGQFVKHNVQYFVRCFIRVLVSASCEGHCCPVCPVLVVVNVGVKVIVEFVVQYFPCLSRANLVQVVTVRAVCEDVREYVCVLPFVDIKPPA